MMIVIMYTSKGNCGWQLCQIMYDIEDIRWKSDYLSVIIIGRRKK